MKRTTKYHLGLIFMLVFGLVIIGSTSYYILHKHAKEQVIKQAGVLMEAALAMRKYTINEIKPLLALQNKRNFLPQSVPSYAATKNFDALRESHSEYRYKEATLNPTNPRDRAADWEADIIQEFRNNKNTSNITLVRDTPLGTMLYYARPIRIKNQGCLTCHGMIEDAPQTMLELYGPANGFGWKMDEVVGSQIVSVPFSLAVKRANETFFVLISIVAGVFLILYLMFILFFKKLFTDQDMAQTAVAAGNTPRGDPGQGRADAPGRDAIQERAVAQGRGIVHDRAVAAGSNATQDRATTPGRNVIQDRIATPGRNGTLDRSISLGRNATQIIDVTQDLNVTPGRAVTQARTATQGKEERPAPERKVADLVAEDSFHLDLADSDDMSEEQSISLEKMYQNHQMTELLVDESLNIEDAITELPLGSKLDREKT